MKAIILARVSTEEQMNEGQSIPAQLDRARNYADRKDLIIQSEHQFDESYIKDKRKKFEQVIEEIKKSKDKVALIVETVDRLQRSFKESVLLDELRKQGKLEIHFIRENLVIHKDSNSSEIQRWDLAVFVAKSYVLQISDNVKRSNDHKIKNGEWIGKAPIGYLNITDEKGNKAIVPDPERSPYIKKIFEMYSSGNTSMRTLKVQMEQLGLKSNNKPPKFLTASTIEHILNNPFYYGEMRLKGKLYPHSYTPIISKALFDKAQEVKDGYHKKPYKFASTPFVFKGLIKCADCGCMITAEAKKGHSYYSCTNYHRMHEKRIYIREENLLSPVCEVLKNIRLSDSQIKDIVEGLRKVNESKNEFSKLALANLRKEYDQIGNRLSGLVDLRLDGDIDSNAYETKLKEYKARQQELLNEMQKYDDADENYYITVNTVLNLAQRAYEIFKSSEVDEKRQILNFLLQNCELKDKNLLFKLKTPFDTVLSASKCTTMLRLIGDVRTCFAN